MGRHLIKDDLLGMRGEWVIRRQRMGGGGCGGVKMVYLGETLMEVSSAGLFPLVNWLLFLQFTS
jgi:hypothetical protein